MLKSEQGQKTLGDLFPFVKVLVSKVTQHMMLPPQKKKGKKKELPGAMRWEVASAWCPGGIVKVNASWSKHHRYICLVDNAA